MESRESGVYRFVRGGLRLWFSLIFRRLRVLQEASLPRSGPVLLVVNHPPGFVEALVLVAALKRRVHCLLDQALLTGPFERLTARALGMIPYEFQGEDWAAVLESVCKIFSKEGIALIFVRPPVAAASAATRGFAPEAAEVALEAEAYLSREVPLPVFPTHLFLPAPPSTAGEILIHIDHSLSTQGAPWHAQEDLDKGIRMLDEEIEKACCAGPFRLQPDQVEQFIAGLETIMREDFSESWSHRANWKQKVEDFDLSPYLIRLTHRLNYGNPGRLAALNEALRNYQERKRRMALGALKAQTAGAWHKNGWRRLAVWVEAAAGFPVAVYGLVNLLVAWFVLGVTGLLKNGLWEASPKEWATRVLIALACYAGQVALVAHFLPREEAGYYAPSLLLSGAYLLRYLWLLEHRISILVGAMDGRGRADRLRRLRKSLIGELKRDQDRYVSAWKIAH
ncbi:MAG: lysophospholipid acyltransferase family protein, partial [Terriglobia bacterium]